MNETKTIDVLDVKGKKAGSAELPGDLFDVNTNIPLIHQVVVAQLAAARQAPTLRRPVAKSLVAARSRGARRAPVVLVRVRLVHRSGSVAAPFTVRSRVPMLSAPPRRWWPLLCVGPCLIWLATTASSS